MGSLNLQNNKNCYFKKSEIIMLVGVLLKEIPPSRLSFVSVINISINSTCFRLVVVRKHRLSAYSGNWNGRESQHVVGGASEQGNHVDV